ncbi:MAG: hypothetical protein ACOC5T_02680 [Elusimicrobiota bacterium]
MTKMKVNVQSFLNFVKKSTVDFLIDAIGFTVTPENIKSGVKNDAGNLISVIDMENNFMDIKKGSCDFNFKEPRNLVTYLNLFDEKDISLVVDDVCISLTSGKQKSKIYFCHPDVVRTFNKTEPRSRLNVFQTMDLNSDFMDAYNKVKKVAAKFGKLYFGVIGNKFYIESADKLNPYANSLKFEVDECDSKDLSLCFDYKNFTSVFNVLDEDYTQYNLSFSYLEEQEMGMVFIRKNDNSEKYFVFSKME